MKQRSDKNGTKNDDWETPQFVLDYVKREFGAFFDPCPLKAGFDGLSIPWQAVNYVNPPYNRKGKEAFIKKAFEESKQGKVCVCLIPSNTETEIFHEVIVPHAEVRLLRKRVPFKGINSKGVYVENATGQTGSMLVIFGPQVKPCIKVEAITQL